MFPLTMKFYPDHSGSWLRLQPSCVNNKVRGIEILARKEGMAKLKLDGRSISIECMQDVRVVIEEIGVEA